MKYYLYEQVLYGITDNPMNNIHRLRTSGKGPLVEIIKGHSGICDFGAHSEPMDKKMQEHIKQNGQLWSTERIRKRLRYDIKDGGKMYSTFSPIQDIKQGIKNFFVNLLNIK